MVMVAWKFWVRGLWFSSYILKQWNSRTRNCLRQGEKADTYIKNRSQKLGNHWTACLEVFKKAYDRTEVRYRKMNEVSGPIGPTKKYLLTLLSLGHILTCIFQTWVRESKEPGSWRLYHPVRTYLELLPLGPWPI